MAETDAFIFAALQQSGWYCLARLQEMDDLADLALPDVAPSGSMGVAARHRMGSKLANVLKLGYAGDCGYNHFLYPSEKETRNILSWLAGKLPRSRLEDGFEEDVQVESATSGDATTAGTTGEGSLLSNGGLANIFSAWKRDKTMYVLPNREMNGLRGFQRLPLQTAVVSLPWGERRDQSVGFALFEGFPSDAVKPTSLLEKLAAAKRGAATLLQEDEFDDAVNARRVGDEQQPREDLEEAAATSFLAPKAGEDEDDDDFASINPQSFLSSALPDAPLSLNTSASPAQMVADAIADGATIAEPTEPSSLEAEKSRQEPPSEEEGELVLEQVQQQVDETQRRLAAMRKVLTRDHAALQQIQQRGLETQATGQDIQRQLATQKQLVGMLPQAQENMAKLEAICSTNAEKKEEIARQMESTRAPLLEEYNALEARKSNRKTRGRRLIREMKTFRQEMHEMTGVIHTKREDVRLLEKVEARQLAKRKEKADAEAEPMSRSMYTNRIMDIIKQVHKQKQEITKVLEDIKALQKQLNSASEKLKRTEAVAEDKLYSAASSQKSSSASSGKADAYVECYRKFAQVRE
ncbi:hypothetical protein BBJ28_00026907, partial [Nothophytophthora sp. Chile5]